MKTHLATGATVTLSPTYAVASGGGALVGSIFGVAVNDTAANTPGEFNLVGVKRLPKAAGAITQGQKLYWDDANRRLTTTVGSNVLIGAAVVAAASGDATVDVRLNGTVS